MRSFSHTTLFMALLFTSVPANAQPVEFGLEAGAGYSTFNYDTILSIWDPGGRSSFNGGFFAERAVSRIFSVQAGLRANVLRNKVQFIPDEASFPGADTDGSFGITQTYIKVPVLLKFEPTRSGTYLVAGPEASYLLTARLRVDAPEGDDPITEEANSSILDSVIKPGLFLSFGLGQELPVGKRQFHLRLMYSLGLTRTAKKDDWFSDWQPQDLSLRIGYML